MQGRSLAEVATGAVILAVALLFLGYAVLNSGRGAMIGNGEGTRLTFGAADVVLGLLVALLLLSLGHSH